LLSWANELAVKVCKGADSRESGIKEHDLHGLQRLGEAAMNYDLRFFAD
jgi:hypothetical protein